ncbi:MAG: helix-turn-helix domain-containing protein [Actinomycetota bacterium]|nr:helix-turn-helix domain-containing protein [Actinomycetota bacterium]
MSEGAQPGRSFADKLNHLFATVHPRDRRPYSMDEVAAGITEQGGEPVSASYLWMLRKGQRDNPTIKTVEAIARFFGVPTAYFFDDELAGKVDEQLELLAKMRDAGLESLGLRAGELSPESRAAVARIIDVASEALAKMLGVVENAEPPGQGRSKKS